MIELVDNLEFLEFDWDLLGLFELFVFDIDLAGELNVAVENCEGIILLLLLFVF
jgi:hypothetical protein